MAILVGGALLLIYLIERPVGLWRWLFFETNLDARKYLLSATAQVLGAIFALMFSLSIVAGQTLVKYTHRALTIIFNKWTFLYALAFAGVIIGILCCLTNPTDGLAIIMLGLGGIFTFISAPAFFWYVVKGMNLQRIPMLIKRTGLYAIKRGESQKAKEMIEALDNIGTVALKEGNFEALEAAEEALVDLLLEVGRYHNDPQRKQPELHREVFESLRNACLEAIDNPRVPQVIIEKLGKVGATAIEEWLKSSNIPANTPYEKIKNEIPQTALYAVNIIMIVAEACEKESQNRILFACAVALGEMLKASSLKSLWDWIAGKIKSVCGQIGEKSNWAGKVKRLESDLGITL